MHTLIAYVGADPEALDARAIADAVAYLGPEQTRMVAECVAKASSIAELEFIFGFVGITGRPFYAWMRRDRLADFRAWMAESGAPTDERGFLL